jgi:hypothetical protein
MDNDSERLRGLSRQRRRHPGAVGRVLGGDAQRLRRAARLRLRRRPGVRPLTGLAQPDRPLVGGASGSLGLALAGFGVGGLIYAPFPATEATLFQRISPPEALTSVLAAQGAITLLAPSIGEVLGDPLVTAVGARRTLLLSAAVTLALGAIIGTVTAGKAVMRRSSPGRAGTVRESAPGARTPT